MPGKHMVGLMTDEYNLPTTIGLNHNPSISVSYSSVIEHVLAGQCQQIGAADAAATRQATGDGTFKIAIKDGSLEITIPEDVQGGLAISIILNVSFFFVILRMAWKLCASRVDARVLRRRLQIVSGDWNFNPNVSGIEVPATRIQSEVPAVDFEPTAPPSLTSTPIRKAEDSDVFHDCQ